MSRVDDPISWGILGTASIARSAFLPGLRAAGDGIDTDQPTFTPAIRHIHDVLRGLEEPRHLAVDDAMGNAAAIESVLAAARRG